MWVLIISLLLLAIVAMAAGYIRNKRLQKQIDRGEISTFPQPQTIEVECCGQHETCEKESLLAAVSRKIEYYDDEELDCFIGRMPDEYIVLETEQFRDVLYTMPDIEVAGWVRSLQLRGINLPDDLKDEVLLIVAERRTHA